MEKTLKELADIGTAAAFNINRSCQHYLCVSGKSPSWELDRPARQAFAAAVRDAVLAKLVTKSDSPPTFEAHGFTWFKHTPGDPMPCDGNAQVNWLLPEELDGYYKRATTKANNKHLWLKCAGWRYANKPNINTKAVTKTVPLDMHDIRATDEFRLKDSDTRHVLTCWSSVRLRFGIHFITYEELATSYLRRQHGSNEWKPCTKEETK